MPHKARAIESALLAKGFRRHDSRHRQFVYFDDNGRPTNVRTLLSHGGNRDVGARLLGEMARQCRLTRREFDDLVRCPLTREGYRSLLVERGGGLS